MSDYEKQANDFLKKTGVTFKAELKGHRRHFYGEKDTRDVYEIRLTRNLWYRSKTKRITKRFLFGQSLADSYPNNRKAPTAYDVLAGLTTCHPGGFNEFCANYGYDKDTDSIRERQKIKHILDDVEGEFLMVEDLWSAEEIEELQEIR